MKFRKVRRSTPRWRFVPRPCWLCGCAQHFDAATAQPLTLPIPSPDDDFNLLGRHYQTWLIEPSLVPVAGALGQIRYDNLEAVLRAVRPLYRRCLASGLMLHHDLLEAIASAPGLTPHDRSQVLAAIRSAM